MARILLLEDDPILAKSLCFNIRTEGYEPIWVRSVGEARRRIQELNFDLMLLDVQLPDGDGMQLCQELRQNENRHPILLITAQNSEDRVVQGLMSGASDYVKKPFSMRELMARIHVHLKGASRLPEARSETKSTVEFQGLKIDQKSRMAFYQDREIKLNHTKFDILYFLVANKQKVISRDVLLQFLQKENEVFDRTIDAHISQIRRFLKEECIEHLRITSIYGSGYKLEHAKK